MNHIYRTVWNHAKGVWQVVGENARRRGKEKASRKACRVLAGVLLAGPALSAFGQGIVTDGRTQTTLIQQGSVTDIHTATIQNGNAFNSFSRFNVEHGHIANLHVPGAANALINIVRDQRTTIDGILNGYKNGVIGGDIYFANPHGFVVGASGVVNVGSLTVTTPDKAFLESMLGSSGHINNAAVDQLKVGNFPISESGLIAVRGRINAADSLRLHGQGVDVSAQAELRSGPQAQSVFEQTVNTEGMASGGAIAEIGGEIHILAAGDIAVAGDIRADGIAGQDAGSVEIRAARDIHVADGARVSASGHGDDSSGGSVTVYAGRNADLSGGGRIEANAGDAGDGGFVEFSARKQVTWAGVLEARSAGGAVGRVLIDPEAIDITADQRLVGTDYMLQADQRITVHDGVMISTRNIADAHAATHEQHRDAISIGDSGDITLDAPLIELGEGAKLYAHTNTDSYAAGDITLTARSAEGAMLTPGVLIGVGSNRAEITLGDNVDMRGRRVSITAEASTALTDSLSEANLYNSYDAEGNPQAEYLSEEEKAAQRQELVDAGVLPADAAAEDQGFFGGLLDTLGSAGLLASVQVLEADADIDIGNGVNIVAGDDVQIAAHAATHAQANVNGLHLGAVVAVTDTDAQLNIGQNSRIESTGGDVTLKSEVDSRVETAVSAMQVSSGLPVTITANVSHAEGAALTTVGSGSLVKGAADVEISATHNKTFDVSATAGDSDGAVGAAVLVALSDLEAETRLAGRAEAGQDLGITATLNTQSNRHAAAVVIGDTLGTRVAKIQSDVTGQTMAKDGIKSVFGKLTTESDGKGGNQESSAFLKEVGLAGAMAYVEHDNTARVVLESDSRTVSGRDATVAAEVTDALNSAVGAEVSDKKNTAKPFDFKGTISGGSATEKKNGAAVAILVSNQNNLAETLIRSNAQLDALRNLDIRARAALPWLEQSRISNLIGAVGSGSWDSFTDTVSKGNQLFSTWVDAAAAVSGQAAADDGSTLSGMVNVNNVGLDANVRVEDGVEINRNQLADPDLARSVTIEAEVESQMVNVSADPVPFSSSGGKNGLGAAVIVGTYDHSAEALVGAVNVSANALNVSADTDVRMINYAMAGSAGGKNAFGGSVAVAMLDNSTRAGVDDGADLDVSAFTGPVPADSQEQVILNGDIAISARDNVDSLTVTGGVVKSTTRAFGVAAGANDFTRVTEAWLGDTATDMAAGSVAAAGRVEVSAASDGMIGNYAISAAVTADNKPDPKEPLTAQAGNKEAGEFGLNVSGSAAVNLVDNTVSAAIRDDLDVNASEVRVDAGEDTALHAIAGGAAVSTTSGDGAGMAGAYTQNTVNADIEAAVESNGTLRADRLDILADNETTALSIAAGVSASLKSNSSYQLAGSVTFNTFDVETAARLANGDVEVTDEARVEASDRSTIKAVAGSASYGGKAGVGAGISINDIEASTTAEIADMNRLKADSLAVGATYDADLVSVAAAMGYSAQYAFDGAVAVNRIDNVTRSAVADSQNIDIDGEATVEARNESGILTVSGTAAASGNAALGASFAYNEIDDSVSAEVLRGDIQADSVRLDATQNVTIDALVAGGAAGKANAATGSVAVNTIDNRATARTIDADVSTNGDIEVVAVDTSRIRVLTGALAYGGSGAGVGIAGSYNEIGGEVLAGSSGGSLHSTAGSVRISATRDQQLQSLAAGAGAGSTGVAGSVAVNYIGGSTTAEIVGGADFDAHGDVQVSATSDSDIETVAGALGVGQGSVGVGGAVAVNDLHGTTKARIEGAGTQVTALGHGSGVSVANGQLDGDESADLRDRRLSETVRGTAVVASSTDELNTVAASIGGSSGAVGAAGAVTVNNVGGSTQALVGSDTTLNASAGTTGNGANAAQTVRVGAYHHTRIEHATGAAGAGGTAGIGLSTGTTFVTHETEAQVDSATIASADDIGVRARATTDVNGVVVGAGAAGTAGGAGSVAVTTIGGTVAAGVAGSSLRSDEGDLEISADAENEGHLIAGALAGGGAAGIGATVIVSGIGQQTEAAARNSDLDAAGTTQITAKSAQEYLHVGATAAGGGTAGVAGTVSVMTATAATNALIDGTSVVNAVESGSAQDVIVSASDRIDTSAVLGTAAGGGTAGVGAGADIQNIRSGAGAEIAADATVHADRDIAVRASNERDVDSKAIAAAGGGFVGAAAGVSVVNVAAGASSVATESLEGSLSNAQGVSRNSGLNGQMGNEYARAGELEDGIRARQATVSPEDGFTTAPDATAYSAAARVGDGATLDAGRDIEISARNKTDAANQAVGVAAGLVGAGAGVAVIDVGDRSLASLGGTADAGGEVRIIAEDGQDGLTRTEAQAGGGGTVGLGAAVAVSDKRSTTTAQVLDGAQITAGGGIAIDADLEHALESETVGAAVGGVAVGASVATATTSGQARALVGQNAQLRGGSVDIEATTRSTNEVLAVGASGGALAGTAVVGTAGDSSLARAWIADDARVSTGSGQIALRAATDPFAKVLAVGASVGAVGVGATVAVSQVDATVEAGTDAVELIGGSLEVNAEVLRTRDHSAEAKAVGATGGVLVGANATVSSAEVDTDVKAQVGSGSVLAINGNATVRARDKADAHVHATGVAAAGILAVGANVATVDVDAHQSATLGGTGVIDGLLTVDALGENAISGRSIAGSGGVIAGHASTLNADVESVTQANVADNADIQAGQIRVEAVHALDYDVESNSMQASLMGASGTFIDLDFESDTTLRVGDNAGLRAYDGIDLDAHGITRGGADAFSGSGGVYSGSAILIDNTIDDSTRVEIGNGARLATIGDPLLEQPAHLTINAHNTLDVDDTARLSVGGLIAAPYAGTAMDVHLANEVDIGDGAQLTSSGLLRAGAYSRSAASTNAEVDIYGLAGAGGGDSEIDLTANQTVTLGANTDLLGYGNVALRAGQSADGIESNDIVANASTTVLNNTLVPVTAALDADAVARSFNDLTLGAGSRIRSVRNIDLLATNGTLEARGKGVEKNPYLALFSSERVEGSSATERKATLAMSDAEVVAGAANRQEIHWDGTTLARVSSLDDLSAAFVPAGSADAFRPLAEIDAILADANARLGELTPGSEEHTALQAEIDLYTQMRTSTAQALGGGANGNTTVDSLVVGDIIAGAGDIKVGADEITQAGATLTAYGAPSVVIHNSSDDYLALNRILVSAPGSGKIVSTGAAKVASSGATLSEVGQSQSTYYDTDQRPTQPSIMIVNSYDTDLPGNNSPAPGMLVLGDIENLKGSTTLRNESGNVSQFARIESKQLTMEVPNGDLFINLPGRSWNLASVQSEWAGTIAGWIPDAHAGTWGRTVPDSVAEYAANLLFNANADGTPMRDTTALSVYLLRDNGGEAGGTGTRPKVFIGTGSRDYRETSADDNANWMLDSEQEISLTGNVSADDHDFWTGDTGLWHWWYPKVRAMQTRHSASLAQADTSGSSQSALKVGGSLAINAKNININADVEVGARTDWSLRMDGSTAGEIANIGASSGFHRLNNVTAIADSDGADDVPEVYWDAVNQRIQVSNIDASGGGSVSLTGNIINTNTLGRITVNSGLGDIAIDNSSGHAVLLQDMDVGSASQSVVKITDTLKTWSTGANAGGVQTWWYVNQAGQDSVSVYNNSNGASSLDTATLASTTGRSFNYNPRAGARYEWTYSYDVERDYTGNTSIGGEYDPMPGPVSAWRSNIETADGRNYLVSEGDVVVRAPTDNSQALMQWATADVDYTTATVTSGPGGWGGYGVGTQFSVATRAQVEITNSVKADHAIPIRFVGQSAANIQVDSNADVLIGGEVRNSIGTTSIDVSNGALQQAGGSLMAQHLDLNASAGIGSTDAALNLVDSRRAGASVSAASQGDIHLAVQGDLYAKRIVTPGDITIHAEGGIYQHEAAVGASIDGDVLNLHSASASTIGSASQPLVTQSNEINASAPGDVLLTQATGNMNVGFISTTFGNVELNTPTGQILSAPPKADGFDADLAEKIALWEKMGVANADHTQSTVTGYQNQVDRRYADYWTIREAASDPDGAFALTATGLGLFRAQAAAILGIDNPSDAQVNAVMKTRYDEAKGFLQDVPGLGVAALTTRQNGFSYTLDSGSEQYRNLTAGGVWEKSMLGGVINAGAEAGTRPSTGGLPNVSAPLGSIRLNNDPDAPLPESETLVFTMRATDGYEPVVMQTYSSEGNTYSASQLLAFLSEAKPGTMESARISDDTVQITLRPRFDLAVESKDPVVIDAFGDYHVGTSQDVILKDITVGGTLYVYAGRDVINQTASGVAGAVTGGLYIDAGRNIGSPDDPIQVTNNGGNPVTIYRLVAPGSANVTVLNGDVVIGKIDVSGETNLIANQGNFRSLGGYAEFNSGQVNLRAVNAMGNTSGHIGTAADPFNVVLNSGSLGLFGLGANVVATSNDLSIGNSELDGAVDLTAQAGSLRMAQAGNVIRTTDDNLGAINMVAATGIGVENGPMELHTSRFNAETPAGDVNLHLHREASANRVHALTGSARVVADGDGQTGTMDLNIGDARVARRLDLQAETMQAAIRQTVQDTPLQITASGVGGVMSETVGLDITAAPYVLFDRLSSRLADIASNATRLNIASGHIKEQMELRTGYVSGLMDNTTPALRYNRDFQYFIPWGDFTLDMNGMGATNSRAPMWFDAERGVFTRNMVTSGYAAFDLGRSQFNTGEAPMGVAGNLPVLHFDSLQAPVMRQGDPMLVAPVSVNLDEMLKNEN